MRLNVLGKSVDLALRWVEAGGSLGLAGFVINQSITAPGSEQDPAIQTKSMRRTCKVFLFPADTHAYIINIHLRHNIPPKSVLVLEIILNHYNGLKLHKLQSTILE